MKKKNFFFHRRFPLSRWKKKNVFSLRLFARNPDHQQMKKKIFFLGVFLSAGEKNFFSLAISSQRMKKKIFFHWRFPLSRWKKKNFIFLRDFLSADEKKFFFIGDFLSADFWQKVWEKIKLAMKKFLKKKSIVRRQR